MAKEKLYQIINRSNRVFNSIKPNQITEVDEANLELYLGYGFKKLKEVVKEEENAGEGTPETQEPELTVAQLKEKITELGGEFARGDKKADLQAILAKLEAGNQGEGGEGEKTPEELAQLLTDAGIYFEEGDDLQKLVEENQLV